MKPMNIGFSSRGTLAEMQIGNPKNTAGRKTRTQVEYPFFAPTIYSYYIFPYYIVLLGAPSLESPVIRIPLWSSGP